MFRTRALFVVLAAVFVVSGFTAASAEMPVIRVMAGGGYTLVNFAEASGYPDSSLQNWDQANYSFSLQCLWRLTPTVRLGAEAGWEQLYYWYYVIPYGYSPVYREANWATIFAGPVVQIFLARSVYVLGGADLHFFSGDGTAVGLSAGIGTEFRLSNTLTFPLEFRVKPVLGKGTPTVLQINLGLAWSAGN